MKIQIAKCLKNYVSDGLNLIKDKEYDVSLNNNGSITLFHKKGWFTLSDWQEYFEVRTENV